MSKIVYLTSPNEEKPYLEVEVWTPDAENLEDVPDTLNYKKTLTPGVQMEVILEERQYFIIREEVLVEEAASNE